MTQAVRWGQKTVTASWMKCRERRLRGKEREDGRAGGREREREGERLRCSRILRSERKLKRV